MATYAKREGGWRAQIRLRGVKDSRSGFRTKAEAAAWAAEREAAIRRGMGGSSRTTLREALQGFARDVSPSRRGKKWELVRLNALAAGGDDAPITFVDLELRNLTPDHFAGFRDRRLKQVAAGTVLRELTLLSAVLEWARLEKRWLPQNPIRDIRKPRQPPARTRLIKPDETRRILLALGYEGGAPTGPSQEVALIYLLALETAMRSGELVGMTWENLNLETRVAHIPLSKNGRPRDVPMLPPAIELWRRMPVGKGRVFSISDESRDVLFRKALAACEIEDLHFHDTRATALTRLAREVDVMTLARISGHESIDVLFKRYYREAPEDIATRLAAPANGASGGASHTRRARPAATAARGRRRS